MMCDFNFEMIRGRRSYDSYLGRSTVPSITGPRVPDGGWGWMVALGSFIVMMLIPMLFPCFGILFSGYLLTNGTSSTTTAWIFNIQGSIWNIMGLFVRPLVDEFGWRIVGFVGITLVSTSLFVSAFTPSPLFLFFSFSLLSGIGGGLVTSMCFLIVPIYFEKRRGVANAIMMAGICSGEIIGPLLVQLFLEEYSFQGANIIIGAILLNGYIGILFFHPVEWHMKSTNSQIQSDYPEMLKPLIIIQSTANVKSDDATRVLTHHDDDEEGNELFGIFLSRERGADRDQLMKSSMESLPLHHDVPNNNFSVILSANLRSGSVSGSLQQDCVKEYKERNLEDSREDSNSILFAIYSLLRKSINSLGILRSPRAAIIATGNMLCMNSALNFVMLVPFAMQALDHSLQHSAWCISMSAGCNLLTRLVVSPMADWERFSMKLCYMGGYALLAFTMFVFPMFSDLKWLEAVMALFGCAMGANMALYNLVMIECMGMENLAPVFGASGLMVGVGFLVFGTITGLVRDMSGSYTASMWMLSAMAATSFFLWFLMPTAVAYDERAKEKGDDNNKAAERDDEKSRQQSKRRDLNSVEPLSEHL